MLFSLQQDGVRLASSSALVQERGTEDEALARLQQIAEERPSALCELTIDGAPAIERRAVVVSQGPLGTGDVSQINLTTAIAVETQVVRFESILPPSAACDTVERVLAAARAFTAEQLPELRKQPEAGETVDSYELTLLRLSAICMPQALSVGGPGASDDGRVDCVVIESQVGSCDCAESGRAPASAGQLTAVRSYLHSLETCDRPSGAACSEQCGCEVVQLAGTASDTSSDLSACQNALSVDPNLAGFCLIDQTRVDERGAAAPLGHPELVSSCPESSRRTLRFVGTDTPTPGASVILMCRTLPK